MSAAIVSLVWPYPADSGKKVVLGGILRFLSEVFGPAGVTFVHVSDRAADPPPNAPFRYHWIEAPSRGSQLVSIVRNALLGFPRSMQESAFDVRSTAQATASALEEIDPELTVYDTFRIGQWFEHRKASGGRHVLYMDDLFSLRYARMRQAISEDPSIRHHVLGTFADRLPRAARVMTRDPRLTRLVLGTEERLVRRREGELPRGFDRTVLVNADEAAELARRTTGPIGSVKPWLKDAAPVPATFVASTETSFTMIGDWTLPHNRAGLAAFITEGLGAATRSIPNLRIDIVGRGVDDDLRRFAKQRGSMVFHGYVDDLTPLFSQARAMLVPLTFGSGVKIKVLEALRTGLPVITTATGREGIELPARALFFAVAPRISEFADEMARFTDADFALARRREASAFWVENYGSAAIRDAYRRMLLGPE